LMGYEFPGNVRELENIIEQAFVLCRGGLIELGHLPPELRPLGTLAAHEPDSMTLISMEKHFIDLALKRHNGNRKKAAHDLGINTSTLFRKIKALGIETPLADGRGQRQ
jgi:transcriptional regulator of acetoin/glycerol metabolism